MGRKSGGSFGSRLENGVPRVDGFSPRNIKYMRAFAETYADPEIVQQLLHNSPLPWGHHLRLLDRVKDAGQRLWHTQAAHAHGWSRAILEYQIETNLYERQGKAISNFDRTLPRRNPI